MRGHVCCRHQDSGITRDGLMRAHLPKRVPAGTIPALLATLLLATADVARAQTASGRETEAKVPSDTAVLDLDLPPGAQVSINGASHGARRQFRFQPFGPGVSG